MKRYYEDTESGITIYHGDCRDILPTFPDKSFDLVLTDPPYGVNHNALHGNNGSKMWGKERVTGDDEKFNPSILLRFPRVIVWGANNFASALPDSSGWIIWNKSPNGARRGFVYSHSELAWTNLMGHNENVDLLWEGADRQGEDFLHPTQKPIALMRWCITRFEGCSILDPFMGSGTTLVAANELGRKAVGIEIEEKYCEIAVKRLAQTEMTFAPKKKEEEKPQSLFTESK